jgi:hypothetical protein
MSWKQPSRARYLVVVPLQGTICQYSRGEGDKDHLWYPAAGWPNPMPQPGQPITSAELVEAISGAIEA